MTTTRTDLASQESPFAGAVAGADTIVQGLREAAESERVRAVILRVDSPGGSGTASDAVWREVGRVRQKKPVIVSMGDYAASGGYYVSMGADAIVASQGTITGSIGVFSGKFSMSGLYAKLGLSEGVVQRGRHARLFSSSAPWNDEDRAHVRALNRAFYATFVAKAAEGRRKTPEAIEVVAQGRVWTGRDAVGAGLVDRLGGLDTALRVARERARMAAGRTSVWSCSRSARASWRRSSSGRRTIRWRGRSARARRRSLRWSRGSPSPGRSRACRSRSRSAEQPSVAVALAKRAWARPGGLAWLPSRTPRGTPRRRRGCVAIASSRSLIPPWPRWAMRSSTKASAAR